MVRQDYTPNNTAELIIAKQRNGPVGKVDLVFRERFARFENAAVAAEPGARVPADQVVGGSGYQGSQEPPF